MTNKRFTNEELMEEIVKLRTLIWEKRDSMDGLRELYEDLLSDYEDEAKERITTLNEILDEALYEGDRDYIESLYEELDYLEEILWEVTGYSQGDTDGDF